VLAQVTDTGTVTGIFLGDYRLSMDFEI